MSRSASYRSKPPLLWDSMVEEVAVSTLFLVQEVGPTCFILKDNRDLDLKFKVIIGQKQSCSCKSSDLCCHILFVMLKVLRVQSTNPLAWQVSLVDQEVLDILSNRNARPTHVSSIIRQRHGDTASTNDSKSKDEIKGNQEVARRPIDDVCPICQDDMILEEPLSYCKKSCGNSIHSRCMRVWAEHRISIGEEVSCPMCRQTWGPLALNEIKKEIQSIKKPTDVYYNKSCSTCRTSPIRGTLYRCLFCINNDLCELCFTRGHVHLQHPFIKKHLTGASISIWEPAERPMGSAGPYGLPRRPLGSESVIDLSLIDLQNPALIRYLVVCLDSIHVGISSSVSDALCAVCNNPLGPCISLRKLPCGHIQHEQCTINLIIASKYSCPIDELTIFPGLKKQQKKRENTIQNNQKKEQLSAPMATSFDDLLLNGVSMNSSTLNCNQNNNKSQGESNKVNLIKRKSSFSATFRLTPNRETDPSFDAIMPSISVQPFMTTNNNNKKNNNNSTDNTLNRIISNNDNKNNSINEVVKNIFDSEDTLFLEIKRIESSNNRNKTPESKIESKKEEIETVEIHKRGKLIKIGGFSHNIPTIINPSDKLYLENSLISNNLTNTSNNNHNYHSSSQDLIEHSANKTVIDERIESITPSGLSNDVVNSSKHFFFGKVPLENISSSTSSPSKIIKFSSLKSKTASNKIELQNHFSEVRIGFENTTNESNQQNLTLAERNRENALKFSLRREKAYFEAQSIKEKRELEIREEEEERERIHEKRMLNLEESKKTRRKLQIRPFSSSSNNVNTIQSFNTAESLVLNRLL